MSEGKILVTGGAGYIGSHVVKQLGESGREVVVLDNLSTGNRDAVLFGELVVGNTGDRELVMKLLQENRVSAVIHFAASTVVPESVSQPLEYYRNNTANTLNLLECCRDAGVKHFVFSSTAAVYGTAAQTVVTEQDPARPESPYGMSKWMSEQLIRDFAAASDFEAVILRYFNVAGADPESRIGQSTPEATHLIKVAVQALTGKRNGVTIFGTDYPTQDGTGVRDYIHVEDLASAHLGAIDYLQQGGQTDVFNCGYGHGYSVKEVLKTAEEVAATKLLIKETARRPGDVGALVADSSKLKRTFAWQPKYAELATIVRHAWQWEQKLK